jgi:hypothetical protein
MSVSLLFRSLLILLALVHVTAIIPYTVTEVTSDVVPLPASAAGSSRSPIGSSAAPMPLLNISFDRPEGTRWFYLYVPQSLMNSKVPVPLVFYFHGYGGDATNGLGAMPYVDSAGYVLISGQGVPGNNQGALSWNAGTWSAGSSSSITRQHTSTPAALSSSSLCVRSLILLSVRLCVCLRVCPAATSCRVLLTTWPGRMRR